jgi:hypothetical protein
MNADDRLSLDPLGRVQGGNRIVEASFPFTTRSVPLRKRKFPV